MSRLPWFPAALVAVSAAVIVRALVRRRSHRGEPTGASGTPEFQGHPWFAATYDIVTRPGESGVLGRLRTLVAGQAMGRVLEIGVGTGANLPYYRHAERIVAIEPDPFMLERARKRATLLGLDVEFHQARAESLPFPDASFDTVVVTLVLCTVADPPRALAEARRVLRPGGALRYVEHVRADSGLAARVQDFLTPVWGHFGAGCHLNRPTAESIRAAGFDIVEMQQEQPFPLTPLIVGMARARQAA